MSRPELLARVLELFDTNERIVRARFANAAAIRKASTRRLRDIVARVEAPATLDDDGFVFTNETPRNSQLAFTRAILENPTPRFIHELDVRITSPVKPPIVFFSSGRFVDWRPRTHIEWVVHQTNSRPFRGFARVRNAQECIDELMDAIAVFGRMAYIRGVTLLLTALGGAHVEEEHPLPLLERNPRRNCVANNLIEATPPATRKEIESVIRERHPELFQPSQVGPDTIRKLAKLTGYQLEFYSPLGRYLKVAPWATFNQSSKHRRIVRMYVDGCHASLDLGKSWTGVEYASQQRFDKFDSQTRQEYFENYEVHQVRYDLNTPGHTVKAIVISKEGKLVIVKREDTRPSLYTADISDQDLAYAHLLSKADILCELFRKRFPPLLTGSHFADLCKRAEKFPRNTLLAEHTGELITIDHNRSFMSYETHKGYIGFPFARFVAVAGKAPEQGDLKPAFYVLSSLKWVDRDAEHVYNSTLKEQHAGTMSAVMYNFLERYTVMEVAYTVLASFAKESVLEFTDRAKLSPEEHKSLSCRLIGSLIQGGLSETRTKRIQLHESTSAQVLKELTIAYQQGLVTHFYEEEGGVVFTMPNKVCEARFHVHSFVLDYSTTTTMGHFIEVYKRARASVVSICADAIRIKSEALPAVRDIFQWGIKPGQWKYELDVLPECYKYFPVKQYDTSTPNYRNNEALPDYVFKELPYPKSRVFISGAGGTGKTHYIIQKRSTDMIMLFPTKELRDHFKDSCDVEARTLAWFIKRSEVGHVPPQSLVVLDEVFMFSRETVAKLLQYAQNKHVYLMGDPAQLKNSFGTPFRVTDLSPAWQRVDFKRGEISRHGKRFGAVLDELRELSDEDVLSELEVILDPFDGLYEQSDIALVATHAEARKVTARYLTAHEHDCPIRRVRARKGLPSRAVTGDVYTLNSPREDDCGRMQSLGELRELTWFDRYSMAAELPESFYYEPHVARTVHSQQGRTIENQRVLVSRELVKIPGALYTAVSRVRDINQLRLGVTCDDYESDEPESYATYYYDNEEGRDY